ncbi:MAG: DUF5615 family PIN-like protein [Thermoleophilia bacterium]|nr:DUF5615 family PIN-like protein [Thermoleophilia bacterium]
MGRLGFFIDECLPYQLARGLAELGVRAVAAKDCNLSGHPDVEIFQYCATNELVFVTRDWTIRRNNIERAALEETGLVVLELKPSQQTFEDLVELLFGSYKQLLTILDSDQPRIFVLTSKGRIWEFDQYAARKNRRRRRRKRD